MHSGAGSTEDADTFERRLFPVFRRAFLRWVGGHPNSGPESEALALASSPLTGLHLDSYSGIKSRVPDMRKGQNPKGGRDAWSDT